MISTEGKGLAESVGMIVANQIYDIKERAAWEIEDIIFKLDEKKQLTQTDRLLISHKIIKECINMPMSVSDHYAEMYFAIAKIVEDYIKSEKK